MDQVVSVVHSYLGFQIVVEEFFFVELYHLFAVVRFPVIEEYLDLWWMWLLGSSFWVA